jgi:hypothetical protein
MRRLTAVSCFLTALGCSLMLSACSSGDESAQPSVAATRVRLRVDAQPDGTLRLNGSPLDRSYVASYPNPDGWTSIELELGPDGIPVVRCARGEAVSSCSETPFFIEIVQRARVTSGTGLSIRTSGAPSDGAPSGESGGESSSDSSDTSAPAPAPTPSGSSEPAGDGQPSADVKVIDTHGTEVASVPVGGSTAGTAGSTCGGAQMGGAPGQGGASKSGETQACESASLADRPGCDATTVAAAAKVYCDTVNAQLPADAKIDCSALTSSTYQPSALPDTRTGEDCSTYWEPARTAVAAAGYESCEKVKLLLTQWRDRARHELIAEGVCRSSPLVLDLDGDGIHLSALEAGPTFDLLGTGQKVRTSWTDGKDAFLALDRNGNGVIDDASELFGNATANSAYADGFTALAELDDDANGVIDARDRAFDHLVVWRDANRDGVSSKAELTSLRDAGIRWLSVSAARRDTPSSLDAHGNAIPLVAEFGRRDGTRGALVDAFFRYRPLR